MSIDHQPGVLATKAYKGFVWQFLGYSLNTLFSIAHIIIMARLLNPEIFGQFAIASILIALTAIVTEFGLGPALVQKQNITDADTTFVFVVNLVVGLVLFSMLFLFSETISNAFDGSISSLMVKFVAFNCLILPLGLASKSMLQRDMLFDSIFIATNLSYFIGMLVIGITLAWFEYGIWSLLIGLLVTNAVASIYFMIVAPIRFTARFNLSDTRHLLRYGVGLTAVQAVNQLSLLSDKLVLAKISALNFLGLYERSQRIQQMPGVFIGGVLDSVLFSTFSRLAQDRLSLGQHFFNFFMLTALVGVYLSALLFTFANDIVDIALGDQWHEAGVVIRILAILISFQLLSRLCDTYIRATGKFHQSVRIKLVYLVCMFSFSLFGFYLAQSIGAVCGIVLASAIHTAMMANMCRLDCRYPLIELWKRLKPGLILGIVLIIKNYVFTAFVNENARVVATLIIVSDIAIVYILFKSVGLMGKDNKIFLKARFKDLYSLIAKKIL